MTGEGGGISPEIFETLRRAHEEETKGMISFFKKDGDVRYKLKVRHAIVSVPNTREVQSFEARPRGLEAINMLSQKLLGMDTVVYEIPEKGVVLYSEAVVIGTYASSVTLLGFDPVEPVYVKLKNQLEELSKQGDPF